jgi:hypothetical protein
LEEVTKSPIEIEVKALPRHPLLGGLKGLVEVMPDTDPCKPTCRDWARTDTSALLDTSPAV